MPRLSGLPSSVLLSLPPALSSQNGFARMALPGSFWLNSEVRYCAVPFISTLKDMAEPFGSFVPS